MCHARQERVLLVGTRSADYIRASGHSGRIQRPYTWLHPTRSLKCPIFLLHRGRRPYMARHVISLRRDRCRKLAVLRTSIALQRNDARCHVWTTPAVQEETLTSQRSGRVQPCIRPLNAAALAAGPDVIRGSGPNQSHALVPRVARSRVFPIDGLDRFASMSSSPLQFLHALTQAHTRIGKFRLTLLPQTKKIDRSCR